MEKIDGNAIAAAVLADLQAESAALASFRPKVVFVRVGDNPASVSYVNKKRETAEKLGLTAELKVFAESIALPELLAVLAELNADRAVHGILVQAPLPSHLPETTVFNAVAPGKDVDGFSALNLGRLCQDDPHAFAACTPAGIIELLHRSGVNPAGKHAVIVGRSLIVGKPVALLLLKKGLGGDATVTVCHSRTPDLATHCRRADILIAALGRARAITADMVKPGAVVIDVGINRISDPTSKTGTRLVGDVDFANVAPLCSKITPVPGGVGPMTVAMLMRNTLQACRQAVAAPR